MSPLAGCSTCGRQPQEPATTRTYMSSERCLLTSRQTRHGYKGLESCLIGLFLLILFKTELLSFATVLYSTLKIQPCRHLPSLYTRPLSTIAHRKWPILPYPTLSNLDNPDIHRQIPNHPTCVTGRSFFFNAITRHCASSLTVTLLATTPITNASVSRFSGTRGGSACLAMTVQLHGRLWKCRGSTTIRAASICLARVLSSRVLEQAHQFGNASDHALSWSS